MTDRGQEDRMGAPGSVEAAAAGRSRRWRFEGFELDEAEELLRASGAEVPLRPQAFEVLRLLVERAPAVVYREEILRDVWHGAFVSETALSQTISEIRRGLGDSAARSRFIGTRYGKGHRLLVPVEPIGEGRPAGPPRPAKRRPRGRAAAVVLGVVLGAVALGGLWRLAVPGQETDRGGRVEATVLAVAGFTNGTGDERFDWLTLGLVERLADRLAAGERVRVAPPQRVALLRLDPALAGIGEREAEDLERLRRRLSADHLIGGEIDRDEGDPQRILVRAWIHPTPADLGQGPAVAARGTGSPDDLDRLGRELAVAVERRLRLPGLAGAGDERMALVVPEDASAAEALYKGQERLWRFDAVGALERLRFAAEKAPESPMVHWALARTWRSLGWDTRAREAAERAMASAGEPFPERHRLLIEGLYHETGGELKEAIGLYQELRALEPGRLDYGLYLVGAQILGGRPGDALETLAELRGLASSDVDGGHLALWEARAFSAASRFEEQSAAARRAVDVGKRRLSLHLVAEGLFEDAISWSKRGESQRSYERFKEAEQHFDLAGDDAKVARCRVESARALGHLGRSERAMTLASEALDLALQTGQRVTEALALHTVGWIHFGQKRSEEGLRRWQEARDVFAEIGDRLRFAGTLKSIGAARYDMGDLEGAVRDVSQAIGEFRDMEAWLELSFALSNRGLYLWDQGLQQEAHEAWNEGMASAELAGSRWALAVLQINRGWAAEKEGRWQDASERLAQAEQLARELGREHGLSHALLHLATVAQGLGQLGVATSRATESRELAAKRGDPLLEAQALRVLGDLAITRGARRHAEQLLEEAAQLAQSSARGARWEGEARLGLARLGRLCGEWREAGERVDEAVSLFAGEDAATRSAARLEGVFLLVAQGLFDAADEALRAATAELDPEALTATQRWRFRLAAVGILNGQERFAEALDLLAGDPRWRAEAPWQVRTRLEVAEWVAAAHTGRSGEAERALAKLESEATSLRFVVVGLEVALARAGAAALSGQPRIAARSREVTLAQASELGFDGLGE